MSEQTLNMSSDEQHHEVLMQLEAIIFASDAPVSLASLKEAFQARSSLFTTTGHAATWPVY